MFRKSVLILIAIASYCTNCFSQEWHSIFNGQNLDGWRSTGPADFIVQGGMIIGCPCKSSKNSFLITDEEYDDFILEFEFLTEGINSGVQFRSHKKAWYYGGDVYGYQYEIDPSERSWSGGIFYENSREWIKNLSDKEQARQAYNDGWNKARIEAIGNHIQTYLNGVLCCDIINETDSKGFIALQVHLMDTEEGHCYVYWKNLRILENPESITSETLPVITQKVNVQFRIRDMLVIRKIRFLLSQFKDWILSIFRG